MWEDLAAEQLAETAVYPGDAWVRGDPAELGFDPAALERIVSEANPETSCIVVSRHGEIVGEWYLNGFDENTPANTFSVTQAYSGTLVGIAQDEGYLDIDDKVSKYIPEWVGTPSENVTIRDILNHVSGRESTNSIGNTDLFTQFLSSADPGAFAATLGQEHEPGTVWSQNLPAIELLNPILRAATGQDPAVYAQEKLFAPIGATHTRMTQTVGANATWMHGFLEATCHDAARFGHLFLRNGNWNGTQVVSEEWVREATNPSQDLNQGWGYFWWLNRPGSLVSIDNVLTPDYDETSELKLVPEAPDDMYWALGLRGQFIQVHPSTDTVVARFGGGDEATNMQLVTRLITEAMTE